MIWRSVGLAVALGCVGLGQAASAQATPASSTGTGTVTGHVICDDTQRPARFAGVLLFGIPSQVTVTTTPQDVNDPAAIKKALRAGLGNVNLSQAKTGVDGSYVLNDVTIRLGGMHSVSGRIRAVSDGHGINSAAVKLTDMNDKEFSRTTGVDANGAFVVTLVPPGSYKVEITDAEDTRPSAKESTGLIKFDLPETVRTYDEATGSVVVTDSDVTGQDFDLKISAVQTRKPSLGDLLKTE
jgi:hypothetical protein